MTNNMIEKALFYIKEKEGVPFDKAFDKLLCYLAVNLFIDTDVTVEFKEGVLDSLDSIIDIEKFKASKHDCLSDVYYKYISDTERITPDFSKVIRLAGHSKDMFPNAVFATNVDTAKMVNFPKNVMVYTTSKDLLKYRMDLINRSLFHIPLISLYIGKLTNEDVDLEVASPAWEFANKWNPVKSMHIKRARV